MTTPLAELRDVSKAYAMGDAEVHALRQVSFAVSPGQMVAVMGASGSGKSTLLNVLGTLDRPGSGEYLLEGQSTARLSETELAALRNRRLGFVFQSFNLLPRFTALENVVLPMIYAREGRARRRKKALTALEEVGMADRGHHLPTQLSGGQQQRVAIARAIVNEPALLLADEPTGALDSVTGRQVMELFCALNAGGITIVIVTHDPAIAEYAGRVVTFQDGRIVSDVDRRGRVGSFSASLSLCAALAPRPLTLAEAVDLALRSEPLVAEAHIAQDRARLGTLRSQLDRVSLKVDGSLQEVWTDTNILGAYQCLNATALATDAASCAAASGQWVQSQQQGLGFGNLTASLNVPVFSGFRVEANVGQHQRLEEASTAGLRAQIKDTAIAVARAYWAARRIDFQIDVQQAALARLREAEEIAHSRVRAGLAPPIDQNRATARRLVQEASVADLRGQRLEALAALGVALGVSEPLELTDEPSVSDQSPGPVDELLGRANADRPELKLSLLQIDAQHEGVRKALSGYWPQLNAYGLVQAGNDPFLTSQGYYAPSATNWNPLANSSGNMQLGLTLSINLFDTLNTYTAVKDARAEETRLREELRREGRAVESDVRLAHARLMHLYGERAPLEEARNLARENVAILGKRYQDGEALLIELLDAQVELASAESRLADLMAQLQIGWLELSAALGEIVGVSS